MKDETKERGTEGRQQKGRDAARYPAGAPLIQVREAAPVPAQLSEWCSLTELRILTLHSQGLNVNCWLSQHVNCQLFPSISSVPAETIMNTGLLSFRVINIPFR